MAKAEKNEVKEPLGYCLVAARSDRGHITQCIALNAFQKRPRSGSHRADRVRQKVRYKNSIDNLVNFQNKQPVPTPDYVSLFSRKTITAT